MRRPTIATRPTEARPVFVQPAADAPLAGPLAVSLLPGENCLAAMSAGDDRAPAPWAANVPAPRRPWRSAEAHSRGVPSTPPRHTDRFDHLAIEHTLHMSGDTVLAAMTGLGSDALAQPARAVRPAQWWTAYNALDARLNAASRSPSVASPLGALLRDQHTAYGSQTCWPKVASIVELAPTRLPATLLLTHPGGNVAGYLASLWQHNVGVVVGVAPAAFWPAAGREAFYGSFRLATDNVDTVRVAGLELPMTVCSCRLALTGTSRTLHVAHVPWRDFEALRGEALAHIAQRVEALRTQRAVAVHCGAGLGRSGTFALAHAMVTRSAPPMMRDVLIGFLRLQRRGCIKSQEQFASIGAVLEVAAKTRPVSGALLSPASRSRRGHPSDSEKSSRAAFDSPVFCCSGKYEAMIQITVAGMTCIWHYRYALKTKARHSKKFSFSCQTFLELPLRQRRHRSRWLWRPLPPSRPPCRRGPIGRQRPLQREIKLTAVSWLAARPQCSAIGLNNTLADGQAKSFP